MKKNLIIGVFIILIAIIGIFIYRYTQREVLSITGPVNYYAGDLSLSADSPEGYYIGLSPEKIYLKGENLSSFLGKTVNVNGFLDGEICGNDGVSCFPLLIVKEINASEQ